MNERIVVERHHLALGIPDALDDAQGDVLRSRREFHRFGDVVTCINAEERLLGLLGADESIDHCAEMAELAGYLTDHHTALFAAAGAEGSHSCAHLEQFAHSVGESGIAFEHNLDRWMSLHWWGHLSTPGRHAYVASQNVTDDLDGPPHLRHLRQALVQMSLGDVSWSDRLPEADRALRTVGGLTAESAWFLDRPVIAILRALAYGDAHGLAASVDQALHAHRAFWTATPSRRADPRGMVSLPITALCRFADSSSMPLEVESGYVPDVLLRADWYSVQAAGEGEGGVEAEALGDLIERVNAALGNLEVAASIAEPLTTPAPAAGHFRESVLAATQSILLLARESEAEVTEIQLPPGMGATSAVDLFYRFVLDADGTELVIAVAALPPDGIRAHRRVNGVVLEQGSRGYLLDLLDEVHGLDEELARALTRGMVSGRMRSVVTTPLLDADGNYRTFAFTESDIRR